MIEAQLNRIKELEKALALTERLLRAEKKKKPSIIDIFKKRKAA